ncbi:hypothetical protein FY528_04810 [Hymenobacter lutimineralis]|uniref:TNase-like domain-containing protein n=1 Tax=Hymenobacter lutimineralis TaxID=2606448 RepID=A0A5D6V9H4_9BACT|nr:thermonuclease family protein [Hymenobacter lutimineralis]TYZ12621.1 hypothetical protein FY528_04810 [Hymenobacter lutimineralis]
MNTLELSFWCIALVLPYQLAAQNEWARVVRVVDGDTYELRAGGRNVRVRLLGADAPELKQPGGLLAADSVRRLLRGRAIRVQRGGADLYGRQLGRLGVELAAGGPVLALDSVLVVRGWAWAYDPNHTVAGRAAQQQQAQAAGRGLWRCGTLGPVEPARWRRMNKLTKLRNWVSCPW